MAKVAFYTFGILRGAVDHPQMQPFIDRGPQNFEGAEQSDGFIDYAGLHPEISLNKWGDLGLPRFFPVDAPGVDRSARTLSVWTNLESVFAFAYVGVHAEALSHRKEWFLKPDWPTYVVWWIQDNHTPQWNEAQDRHVYLHEHGSSPYAFDFKHPFGANGNSTELDRILVKLKIERNTLNMKP